MSLNLKTETLEADGIRFDTTQFAAFRGLELMGRLVTTIGPALGVLSAADPEASLESMAPVIAGALRGLQPTEVSSLALEILASTSATYQDGSTLRRVDILSKEAFDRVFSGRLKTMFKVLIHALKVNYSDFGLGGGVSETPPQVETSEK